MARPKYRLTEKAYIDDRIYDPEDPKLRIKDAAEDDPKFKPRIIEWDGEPAHYMVPMNDEAEAMVRKHPPRGGDPLEGLTISVGPRAKKIEDVLAASEATEAAKNAKPATEPAAAQPAAKAKKAARR